MFGKSQIYWIDPSQTKAIDGKQHVKCRCVCCRKCWLNVATGWCLYGGPYSGYENVGSDVREE